MGVNKHRLAKEDNVDVLVIDNTKVREKQIARLKQVRETRDKKQVGMQIHIRGGMSSVITNISCTCVFKMSLSWSSRLRI